MIKVHSMYTGHELDFYIVEGSPNIFIVIMNAWFQHRCRLITTYIVQMDTIALTFLLYDLNFNYSLQYSISSHSVMTQDIIYLTLRVIILQDVYKSLIGIEISNTQRCNNQQISVSKILYSKIIHKMCESQKFTCHWLNSSVLRNQLIQINAWMFRHHNH